MPLYRLCWKLLISSRESCLVLQLQMPLCPCLDIIIKGKFEPKHQVLPAFNGIIMISIESRKSWCFGNLAPSLNFFQIISHAGSWTRASWVKARYPSRWTTWDCCFLLSKNFPCAATDVQLSQREIYIWYENLSTHRFLDSLVVRISACHVEGPGSIPGRGGFFFQTCDICP